MVGCRRFLASTALFPEAEMKTLSLELCKSRGGRVGGQVMSAVLYALLLVLLTCPVIAYGQSTLNFPRAFTPSDLATTGFAAVNPGTSNAPVTFRLYGPTGVVLATSSQII